MFARLTMFEDIDLSAEPAAREWERTEGVRLSRQLPGYLGSVTLIDREHRRVALLGLYDSLDNLRRSDEILDGPPPDSMPEPVKRARRAFVGLFEVIERDGVEAV
jgi:hypothetical protein